MKSTVLSTRSTKLAVGALLAAALFMASALTAKASDVGDPITPEFNYVGIHIGTTVAGDINEIVYKPSDGPAVAVNGQYTDSDGNFKVPKDGGLDFPPIAVDLDLLVIDGEIALTEDGTGTYDGDTGKMTTELSLSLTLGVDDLEALSDEVGIPLGSGELRCEFSPLDISSATEKGWPAPGKNNVDKAGLTDGAIAGAWRTKPAAVAKIGDQSVCNIIGGFLKPVGGIWLANDPTESITGMPAPTELMPGPGCDTGKTGTFPNCVTPPTTCPEGTTGTHPNCVPVEEPAPRCNVASVKVSKGKAKAGKAAKLKVTVRNTGTAACKGKVALKSNKKFAKVAKSVAVNVAAGKSQTKTITVRTTKKAKGKVKITATFQKKKGNGVVTVQKAKKKKRRYALFCGSAESSEERAGSSGSRPFNI